MLGMFHLLPLLKGWEYKMHLAERSAVVRGADPLEVLSLDELGWLLFLDLITDDCYGELRVDFQGAELQTHTMGFNPEVAHFYGVYQGTQQGIFLYQRNNPESTAGVYYVSKFMGGFFGATWPYYPTIKLKLYLPTNSTQSSAFISGAAQTIAITNKKAFMQSLRRVLGAKADLWIDPALFVLGPAEMEEKPK